MNGQHRLVRVTRELLAICLSVYWPLLANGYIANNQTSTTTQTNWQVVPSFKFDALCFLGVMTGDPFYLKYYKAEYSMFADRLTPAASRAFAELKRKLKDENHNIISAFLCLHFSATEAATIDEMLKALDQREALRQNLRKTDYFNEKGWRLFESVANDLKIALAWLKAAGFIEYWNQNILPALEHRRQELAKHLSAYDIVPEVERYLGRSLNSHTITIYLLHFAEPHAIRLTGTRFVANTSYPFAVIVQTAVHEMLHPPFYLAKDLDLRNALATLKRDAFLMDQVLNHNPSFGYNSFESFIEEDCVRALEQVITERLNISRDARARWKAEDDGIHVFSAALYQLMLEERFRVGSETLRAFLLRMSTSGRLGPGRIKPLYERFYGK